ncbi:hypothetical protein M5689_020689 [Euphorbia peplus]|nr:hypothetical protein M5689_020689 [Euphorbia peplus]
MIGALYFNNKIIRLLMDECIRKNIPSPAARNQLSHFDEGFRKHKMSLQHYHPSEYQPLFLNRGTPSVVGHMWEILGDGAHVDQKETETSQRG